MNQPKAKEAPSSIVGWQQTLAKYRRPHHGRSIWQIINTVGPYLALWVVMILSFKVSYWRARRFFPVADGQYHRGNRHLAFRVHAL